MRGQEWRERLDTASIARAELEKHLQANGFLIGQDIKEVWKSFGLSKKTVDIDILVNLPSYDGLKVETFTRKCHARNVYLKPGLSDKEVGEVLHQAELKIAEIVSERGTKKS